MPIYVKAHARSVDTTPRKAGVVASLVRGRSLADALIILEHTPRRAALPITKVLKSAQANATHNHNAVVETLQIAELHIGPGPRMKRFRPVARGSAHPFQKRTTHISVTLSGEEKVKKQAVGKTTSKKPSTKAQSKGEK